MSIVPDKLAGIHPQMLRAQSEIERKKLGEDLKPLIGKALERAIAAAGLTKQEVAYDLGYTDAGTISRWCAGTERPQFDKLFALAELREPLCVALAQMSGADVMVTVKFKRSA